MTRRCAVITCSSLAIMLCIGAGILGAGILLAHHRATSETLVDTSSERQPQKEGSASQGVELPVHERLSRLAAVDIVIDAKDKPLAAYQVSFAATTGDVRIVSIEGGEHTAFAEAPYYDPAAIQNHRANFAGFSTNQGKDLPTGKTRVARVHVEIHGDVEPQYDLKLEVAATVGGESIPVQIFVQTPKGAL